MKNLSDYVGLDVVVTDDNNKRWKGNVVAYSPEDLDDGVGEAIILRTETKVGIEFGKRDIKSISVLSIPRMRGGDPRTAM